MNNLIILGANYLHYVSIFIAILFLVVSKELQKKRVLILAIFALSIAFVTARIAGFLFYNPRPFVMGKIQPLIPHAANNGFPSDHVLLTMTIATTIFVYNRKLGIFLSIIALFVGVSRVLARVHNQVDIFGAVIIAIASVWISWCILKKVNFINHER